MATQKYSQELPEIGVRYDKTIWEPERSKGGETVRIYGGVVVQARDGSEGRLERWLSREEVELSCKDLKGFAQVVATLAWECYDEMVVPRQVPQQEPVVMEELSQDLQVSVPEGDPLEPSADEISQVLAGLEPSPSE